MMSSILYAFLHVFSQQAALFYAAVTFGASRFAPVFAVLSAFSQM